MQRFWVKKPSFLYTLEIFWSKDWQFNNCSLQSPSRGAFAPSPLQGTSPGSWPESLDKDIKIQRKWRKLKMIQRGDFLLLLLLFLNLVLAHAGFAQRNHNEHGKGDPCLSPAIPQHRAVSPRTRWTRSISGFEWVQTEPASRGVAAPTTRQAWGLLSGSGFVPSWCSALRGRCRYWPHPRNWAWKQQLCKNQVF